MNRPLKACLVFTNQHIDVFFCSNWRTEKLLFIPDLKRSLSPLRLRSGYVSIPKKKFTRLSQKDSIIFGVFYSALIAHV